MTNKEILQADLLDILFENRNKAYGAYALRKNYNHRLQWALGIGLSMALILIFVNFRSEGNQDNHTVNIKEFVLPTISSPDKKSELPKQQSSKPHQQNAQAKLVAQIKFVPDNIKPDIPDQTELQNSQISDQTKNGMPDPGGIQSNNNGNGNELAKKDDEPEKQVILTQSDAQFPGGKDAFAKFLTRNLITPDELEAGEKKIVLVRFKVDIDGTISKTEIIQTGGDNYTHEVLRVLAKMPKWIPAMQNGNKVATWFVQAVTFIGLEQ